MKAFELKLCLKVAQDSSVDLSGVDDSILFGCGLPDFQPVAVSVKVVAKLLRYQCQCFDGSWDWREYNECTAPALKRNVEIAEMTGPEAKAWLVREVSNILKGVEA